MNNVIPIHSVATACATIPYADLVQSDRVHTSLYTNAAIFEEEMQKVFYANWIWVGHASEVPEPGNFKSTYIGQQPVVLVRDRKNALNVLNSSATGASRYPG